MIPATPNLSSEKWMQGSERSTHISQLPKTKYDQILKIWKRNLDHQGLPDKWFFNGSCCWSFLTEPSRSASLYNELIISKDAGFVHESFRNETNRVIWDFWPYETNPQKESFENCVTKRIHETKFLNAVGRNESTKWTFWKPVDSQIQIQRIRTDSSIL